MRLCVDCGKPSGGHRWCWACAELHGGSIREAQERKKNVITARQAEQRKIDREIEAMIRPDLRRPVKE